MKIKTALIVPLLSLLVAVGVCSAAPPPFPFITNPALLLPTGCTNGQIATYTAATNRWACASASGTGDLLADGTVAMTALFKADLSLQVKNGTDSPGFVDFYEDGSNGSSYFRLYGPDALAGNIFMKLPETAGTTGGQLYFSAANTLAIAAAGAQYKVWTMGAAIPAWSDYTITPGTNTFAIANGTASLDIAAGATLNIDKSLQVATGAVVINGNAGGSSVLGLPNQTLNFTTMTNAKLCGYNSTGTAIECDKDATGGTPTVITVADEAADASSFPLFVTAATGDLGPKTDTAYTYDPTTGTVGATKFSGAFNGTVGATTPAAGTFTSITIVKSSGVAGDMGLYEANSTDTHAAGFRGPDSITGDGAYRIKFPDARAAAAGQVLAVTNAGEAGAGTAASPYIQTGSWITPIVVNGALGTPSFTALNIPSANADPGTTAGQISHDSSSTESQTTARGVLKWFDGTSVRTIADIGTDSTIIVKTEFLPIRWAEDGTTAPSAAAEVGTTTIVGRSFTEADDVVFWWVVPLDYVGGIKYRVIYALSANAQANETVIFSMAGSDMVHSGALAGSAGTALTITQELTTDEDTGEVMITDYSAESNADWNLSAGALARLNFSNAAAGDYTGEPLVIGIEIKYKAKLVGFAGY